MKEQRDAEVELAKQRCRFVIDRIQELPASTKITDSCRRTLLKLARSELSFLSCFASSSATTSTPLSVNIGHLEAVVHILQQPFITGVSRVCKSVPLLPTVRREESRCSSLKDIHVDIVCTFNRKPVWIIVSDRNPRYISWHRCHKSKGLELRMQEVLAAAQSSLTLRPSSVILFFANGIANHVYKKLQDKFGASEIGLGPSVFNFDAFEESEGDWINILARSYKDACILEIKPINSKDAVSGVEHIDKGLTVDSAQLGVSVEKTAQPQLSVEDCEANMANAFCSIVLGLKLCSLKIKNLESSEPGNYVREVDLINFDTTALIALVTGISNGGAQNLLARPESELRERFKGNYEFVVGQAMSEIQNPIHVEFSRVLCGKTGMICESVHMEFKELVLMCGGPNEKLRADKLINSLRVVPDCPSERMMGLPTTRKLAMKNKVVFGTGDYWHAPTLTANMAFVRAVSQTGMSLSTIEHRPRALIGD
ncbi:uncharacterized protein LOC114715806 [Neltuma alba]|uniref:uncharacterized protein LOC114715806 n=1 Tax=Neltuma alba TaxID=207710 RepID=UPI0010A37C72|nr:uncharacterized protein LOC114715806 [Prosopis alba]